MIVAAGTAWYFDPRRASGPTEEDQASALPLPDKPSIAVLPFDNLSDNAEEEYFADGLTDDLITDLSKISGLFIIARNSVFAYKDKALEVPRSPASWACATFWKAACAGRASGSGSTRS